jgi:hypothetical protein
MSRRRFVPILAALLALVLTGVTVGYAHADEDEWPWPDLCTEGAITSWHIEGFAGLRLTLDGWARPCPEADPKAAPDARHGLAFYEPYEPVKEVPYAYVHGTRDLDPDAERTDFSVTLGGPNGPDWSHTDAICIVSGITNSDRMSCVAVDFNSFRPTVTPISTDDPMVSVAVAQVVGMGTTPFCGSCP